MEGLFEIKPIFNLKKAFLSLLEDKGCPPI